MRNVWLILGKEWLEIRQQPMLLLGIVLPPLFLSLGPLALLLLIPHIDLNDAALNTGNMPQMAGLKPVEMVQVQIAMMISLFYLILPGIITSIIASYSIVGEKVSRTLEPLLATPVKTWELLLGKCLGSLLPGIGAMWSSALVFVLGLVLFGADPHVLATVFNPAWLVLVLVWAPLLAVIAIAVMIAISSRVNEPRTAQQASAWLVVPLLAMVFSQVGGLQVFGLGFTLGIALLLFLLAMGALWLTTLIFRRETILTRWK